MLNVLSPRDLVSRPDNMDKTVPHTFKQVKGCVVKFVSLTGFLPKNT